MSATAIDETIRTLSAVGYSDIDPEWLEAACLGQGLPPEVQAKLDAAARAYSDEGLAESFLLQAYMQASDHPAVHIALYRFYFYKNRLLDALGVGERCLRQAARNIGLSEEWHEVRPEQADFGDYAILPRFYLFTLKACAYLNMRLGRMSEGEAILTKLIELDPGDKLGGSVLRGVLDRIGVEDED